MENMFTQYSTNLSCFSCFFFDNKVYMCLDQESGEQIELKGEFSGEVIIKKEKIYCFK